MISRDEALKILNSEVKEKALLDHSLETEAVMRGLAEKFSEDQELWGITVLLHDLDYPETKDKPEKHGLLSAEKLADKLPDEALQAIRAHNSEMTKVPPQSRLDFALRCGETVTGLVSANALVRPEKMQGMKPKSLKKKMKDKSFAANVSRERLKECEKIELDLNEFFQISITAIAGIAEEVGLD